VKAQGRTSFPQAFTPGHLGGELYKSWKGAGKVGWRKTMRVRYRRVGIKQGMGKKGKNFTEKIFKKKVPQAGRGRLLRPGFKKRGQTKIRGRKVGRRELR